jgi:hypothetical protein
MPSTGTVAARCCWAPICCSPPGWAHWRWRKARWGCLRRGRSSALPWGRAFMKQPLPRWCGSTARAPGARSRASPWLQVSPARWAGRSPPGWRPPGIGAAPARAGPRCTCCWACRSTPGYRELACAPRRPPLRPPTWPRHRRPRCPMRGARRCCCPSCSRPPGSPAPPWRPTCRACCRPRACRCKRPWRPPRSWGRPRWRRGCWSLACCAACTRWHRPGWQRWPTPRVRCSWPGPVVQAVWPSRCCTARATASSPLPRARCPWCCSGRWAMGCARAC